LLAVCRRPTSGKRSVTRLGSVVPGRVAGCRMGNFRDTSRYVLCLAGTAALLILIDTVIQCVTYARAPDGAGRLIEVVIGGIIALIVPCCGWQGVRDRSDGLLCWFSYCSYVLGCCDVIVVAFCGVLFSFAMMCTNVANKCDIKAHPDAGSCTQETRASLYDICNQFNIEFNASVLNSTTLADERKSEVIADVTDMLSDEKCIDTLKDFGFMFAVVGAVVAVARCFNMCLHCASGYQGGKLREVLKDDPHGEMSSDSDSD